jgi:hypothetical protein
MKKYIGFFLFSLYQLTSGCHVTVPVHSNTAVKTDPGTGVTAIDDWGQSGLNTAINADYLSHLEKEVILEVNKFRSNPARYAEDYLVPYRQFYNGRNLEMPGQITIVTNEGVKPLDECIAQFKNAKPLPILTPEKGLCHSARDHAVDQGKTGKTGHEGSDGSTMTDRLNRYGKWSTSIAENIDYGNSTAREIVISLLIDDGVSSRGHRKNLLNGTFHKIGVATGSHPEYGYLCVMDFAAGYQ